MSECGDIIAEQHEVTKQQAEDILLRVRNMAQERARAGGIPIGQAVDEVTQALQSHDKMVAAVTQRNILMARSSKENIKDYVRRFPVIGDGIMAMLEGSNKGGIKGSRYSIDYQSKAINRKYFGELVASLEKEGVFREFRTNELNKQVYQEMGQLKPDGKPGISGSEKAMKIAKILDDNYRQMTARQNRAGAFIGEVPGYTGRQTHDITKIRAAGGDTTSRESSFRVWNEATLPLLDREKTFMGADPAKFMRNVHESLYTGVHGAPSDVDSTGGWGVRGDVASRLSKQRVLHFADADAAFKYNEQFGVRDLKEQVISDINNRSKSLALMENLGPTPRSTLDQAIRELQEEVRPRDDAAKQVDSVNMSKINAAYNQLTGINDIPANPNMARVLGNIKTVAQMAKMGAVSLTKIFGDKAFLQAEMAHQGISTMQTLAAQVTGLAKRSPEEIRMLRLMGVAMDGLQGNALSRYSSTGIVSGTVDRMQKKFFDLNFLNYITDVHKATAGELMAARLGQHADLPHEQLPQQLSMTLAKYDIGPAEWNQLRQTAWTNPSGDRFVTPDKVSEIQGLTDKERDKLETKLRTYYQDRVDYAVPTPGAAEKRLATMDTKAGTPIGEAVRLMMLFKSFPITIANKVITRDVYGNGAMSAKQWLLNDHQGKFNLATMIAMATVGGYMSMSIRDAIAGRSPRQLMTDGKVNWDVLNESAIRGGGLGMMGDLLAHDYERNYTSFLETAAGPVLGQLDTVAQAMTKAKHGEDVTKEIGKMTIDNLPYANLFYIRPVLDYYVLWNLQEMMSPGTKSRVEQSAIKMGHPYYRGISN